MAEQLREIKKIKLFTLFLTQPLKFTLIRTLLLYTRKQNDCKRALAKKPLRKLLQWQTNTLGVPSSQVRDFFFLMGNISYSKDQNLSCGRHPKKKALLDSPASSNKRTDTGVCTPACKNIDRVDVHENCCSQQSLREMFPKGLHCLLVSVENPNRIPPTHFLHLKQPFTFLDVKTHKRSPRSVFHIQFHLTCEKDRQGLMGKTVLYTTVLKTSHPPTTPQRSHLHKYAVFTVSAWETKTLPRFPPFSHNQAWKDYNYTKS